METSAEQQHEVASEVAAPRSQGWCGWAGLRSDLFAEPQQSKAWIWALRVLNPLSFVAVAVVNAAASMPSAWSESDIGDVSDRNPTPFTPAGYAFSIWGLIYLFQAVLLLVYQFMPFANQGMVFRRIAGWSLALSVLNIAWTFAFQLEQLTLSCVIIWTMFACLATIYVRLHVGADGSSWFCTATVRQQRTWVEYFCVYVPWSLYFSWLVGASLLNIFIAIGKPVEEMTSAGVLALTCAAFANIVVLLWARDVWFGAVNVWTLVAIANNSPAPEVWGVAVGLAGVVGACAVLTWVSNVSQLPAVLDCRLRGKKAPRAHDYEQKQHIVTSDEHNV